MERGDREMGWREEMDMEREMINVADDELFCWQCTSRIVRQTLRLLRRTL